MNRKNKNLIRIISCVLLVALILPYVFTTEGSAALSLAGIEGYKQRGLPFQILEIVPSADEGSIGFYVPGYEPLVDEITNIAYDSDDKLIEDKDAMLENAKALRETLKTKGLLGDDTAPLKSTGELGRADELLKKPWEVDGLRIASVPVEEVTESDIDGSFVTSINGDYSLQEQTAVIDDDGEYILEASRFELVTDVGHVPSYVDDGAKLFFPVGDVGGFDKIDNEDYKALVLNSDKENFINDISDVALYTISGSTYTYVGNVSDGLINGSYDDNDTSETEDDSYTITDEGYYWRGVSVDVDGTVTKTYTDYDEPVTSGSVDADNAYYAAYGEYAEVDDGYISVENVYEYIGDGNQQYAYDSNDKDAEEGLTIRYSVMYPDLKIENNDLFNKHVFNVDDDDKDGDLDEERVNIIVNTKAPGEVTVLDINNADLIVITNGSGDLTGTAKAFAVDNDITTEIKDSIIEYVGTYETPLIIENGLTASDATNIKAVATKFDTASEDHGYLAAQIYVFNEGDSGALDLATDKFMADLTTGVYSQIEANITNENNNREANGEGKLEITAEFTIAHAIRDIINYKERIIPNNKTSIEVLEIQPIVPINVDYVKQEAELNDSVIKGWLGLSDEDDLNINITIMSTSEFIANIDDLQETYDMVYIGASNDGFNTRSAKDDEGFTDGDLIPNYNDPVMDGMYYTNIGDFYYQGRISSSHSTYSAGGWLNTDFDPNNTASAGVQQVYNYLDNSSKKYWEDGAVLSRYSGNDLTPVKMQEVLDYVDSGFPLILSDKLMTSGYDVDDEYTEMTVETNYFNTGEYIQIEVTSPFYDDVNNHRIYYQWYNDGDKIEGATTHQLKLNAGGEYYCEVTVINRYDPTDSDKGRSDTFEITADASSNETLVLENGDFEVELAKDTDSRYNSGFYYPLSTILFGKTLTPKINFKAEGMSDVNYTWFGNSKEITESDGSGANLKDVTIDEKTGALTYGTGGSDAGIVVKIGFKFDEKDYKFLALRDAVNSTKAYRAIGCMFGSNSGYSTYGFGVYGKNADDTTDVTSIYRLETGASFIKNGESITLTVAPKVIADKTTFPSELTPIYTFDWYKDGKLMASDTVKDVETSSITVPSTERGEYACVISDGHDAVYDTVYFELRNELKITQGDGRENVEIPPANESATAGINPGAVDNSSYMFEALSEVRAEKNVMSVSEAKSNPEDLISYLNLSKPLITFSDGDNGKPPVYNGFDDDANSISNNEIKFKFTISNPTDITPATTNYDVNLYIDINADGRHNGTNEGIANLVITDASGSEVANGNLKSDIEYTVTRVLPGTYRGAIPWKLEIVDARNDKTHNSEQGISYIKPELQVIKVLQLYDNDDTYNPIAVIDYTGDASATGRYNITEKLGKYTNSAGNLVSGNGYSIYEEMFNDLYKKGLYDIQLTGLHLTAANNEFTKDELLEEFNEYDLVMLGFGDSFGGDASYKENDVTGTGFSPETSLALAEYIESGKSLLMTHDTMSYAAAPDFSSTVKNYFLRDLVGYDRYGVTSTEYGYANEIEELFNKRYGYLDVEIDSNNLVSNNYIKESGTVVTENDIEEILTNNHSIAYQPGSNRQSFVNETQGVSNTMTMIAGNTVTPNSENLGFAKGIADGSGVGNAVRTFSVSQVNSGQITSYPYDVNLEGFGGVEKIMTVSETHTQYLQLNMNAEEVVVWYALTGPHKVGEDTGSTAMNALFANTYNDAVNNAYIFNMGNVTYSGAGDKSGKATLAEAQLFVNTMIAAYRVAAVDVEPQFKDENGIILENFFVPTVFTDVTDEDGKPTTDANVVAQENNRDTAIPFVIEDYNLTGSGEITNIALEYRTGDEPESGDADNRTWEELDNPTIKDVSGDTVMSWATATQYYLYLPADVITALQDEDDGVIEIKIIVTNKNGDEEAEAESAEISIRQLALLDLG